MKTATKFNFKTLTVLILSLVLCCSLAFTGACSNSNGSSSSSSSKDETVYPTDVQSVTNGDFEFSTFKTEAKNFPVSSSIGWSLTRDSYNSSYAPSSTYSSGIINTDETAYNEIAEKAGFAKLENGTYYNPQTPYYSSLVKEGEYVVRNESGKTVNDDKLPMKGNKVLMIHNATGDAGEGTAQKFTSSSSLSLTKGKYGKISLWVKTYGLKSAYNASDFGAYVAIENTVSSSLNPVVIKNIDTKGEWVKYTFYLTANDLTDSSFKVVLGLGFGSGKFKDEYVEGFAYFDDVNFTELSAADFAKVSGVSKTFNLFEANGNKASESALIAKADNTTKPNADKEYAEKVYAVNHTGASYASVNFGGSVVGGKADLNGSDVSVATAINAVNATEFVGDDKVVAPLLREGKAIYAIKNSATDSDDGKFEYTTSPFVIGSGKYYAYTFFVKSSLEVKTRTGLTVTVNDLGKTGTLENDKKTTSVADNVCTDGYENEDNNGWRRYTVLVSNTIDADEASPAARNFSLTFSFGNNDGDNWKKAKGFFVIANFEAKELTESEYNYANTSDAVKVSLTADLPNGVKGDDESTDSYGFAYSVADALEIKNGVAKNVIGYKGVKGGSVAVGGKNDNVYVDENSIAGVINTEKLASGNSAKLTDAQIAEIKKLGKYNSTNKHLQPLIINNTAATSYGFYGESQTLSANTTTLFTVKVKTLGDAKAFVYLADANALDGFGMLAVNGEAYDNVTAVNKPFATEVTSGYQSTTDDGWYIVRFVVTTGNSSKNVRIELFNGSRDGETKSSGVVLFDSVSKTTVDIEDFKTELSNNYEGDSDETAEVTNYTRKPTVIKYDDNKGSLTNKLTGKKYSEKTITYDESAVFTVYKNSKAIVGTFETIDVTHEVDKRTAGDTSDDSSSDSSTGTNDDQSFSWALQITSIIIAAVLIVLLAVVLVKMLVKKSGKNKAVTKTYYNRDSRDKAHAAIADKKVKSASKAAVDDNPDDEAEEQAEVKPYDYDNMENNIEPDENEAVEPENEVVEESAEVHEEGETPAETAEATEEKSDAPAADDNKAE